MLKNKFKDNSGATIIMALLFLLVATVVSAVVVSSALSAQKSAKQHRDQQQAYLTVSSAMYYFQRQIRSSSVSINADETYKVSSGAFRNLLKYALTEIKKETLENGESDGYEASFNLVIGNDAFEPVHVEFSMDAAYRIVVHFSLTEGSNANYYMTLSMNADPNVVGQSGAKWWYGTKTDTVSVTEHIKTLDTVRKG